MSKQITLSKPFTLAGKGLHTGLQITATFCPAPENHGYILRRTDVDGQPCILCSAENVVETTRGTVVARGDMKVSTIEHAMAALYASGIDNCIIDIDGPEMPILDGSALPFIQAIQQTGLVEQTAEKQYITLDHEIVIDGSKGEHIVVSPADHFSLDITIAFESKMLANQQATLEHIDDFPTDVASARTFVFVRDIQPLLELGYIRGGDLDNAIVIYENQLPQDKLDKLADTMRVPRMDATKLGYLNRKPLTWPNEMARHKLLDLVGDLALTGHQLRAHVTAFKPGHTINNKVAREIINAIQNKTK
ncbi:MAG: UDP-3-O-[Bacteroidaceae bacterium]|nr:UDP-3-O-[3-hydroxymyristoyl] N-acetylglucosamine deacetylase [Bacteroidaceae bacterium]